MILVKKGGKLPEGHIQSWFWERGNLKDSLPLKLPPRAPSFSLPFGRMLLFCVLLHATLPGKHANAASHTLSVLRRYCIQG